MNTREQSTAHNSVWRRFQVYIDAHPRLVLFGKAGLLFIIFYIVSLRKLDPDFGWHLQAGNYIRAHGIPAHDVFTYTARQFPWVDHEWGNDVIVSIVYGWGGYPLLSLLYAGLWTSALLVSALRAHMSVLLLAVLAMVPYAGIRPVAWTVLFLAVVFKVIRQNNKRVIWLLPLLFLVWANLHAGFIGGLAMIAYTALYKRRPVLLGVFAVCVLATLLNAYGVRLYVEIARTLFDPALHSQVGEWASIYIPITALAFVIVWGAGGLLFETRTFAQWLRPSVLLLLAALSATRNVPLFIIASLSETNLYVNKALLAIPHGLNSLARRLRTIMLLAFGLFVLYCMYLSFWPLKTNPYSVYPSIAVSYLQVHGCAGGNIFNDYNYGGYLIWKLPSQPVYIDGRMPSWRSSNGQKYLSNYFNILNHPETYHYAFQRYNIRCSLLEKMPENIALIRLLQRDGWQTVVQTPNYVLQEQALDSIR